MTTITLNFGPRIWRATRVTYSTDVQNPNALIIPLGVMVDMHVANVSGLALMARGEVTSEEAEKIGQLFRPIIRTPFTYLSSEFDRVWEADDQLTAFEQLPLRHNSALTFSELCVEQLDVPPKLLIQDDGESSVLESWVHDQLVAKVAAAFWSMLDDHVPKNADNKQLREAVKAAA